MEENQREAAIDAVIVAVQLADDAPDSYRVAMREWLGMAYDYGKARGICDEKERLRHALSL